jgi:GNAT superfamily N-acetyltransferase
MPNPSPVTVLGRLAVDQAWAGKGLGMALLKHAATIIGSRGIFVQALDENAANIYVKFGFIRSPLQPLYLLLSLT